MNSLIDKYTELLRENPASDVQEAKEEDKLNTHEDNFDILRIIRANQNKQRQQKEMNCIIEDPSEVSMKEYEVEETCNSELSERLSRSVIIPAAAAELLGERSGDGRKRAGHRRMESRSFDKSSLKKIMEIDLETTDKMGRKGFK
eukprot:TRINITY_DN6026_c0_g1_i7.p2 TRINITY_DN6026_c0_g1~~TRINITY_DN6026_c0_g1_i7.p2  ORF type:complete len:145 (+),score=58.57 TRINITY_DN6026_c0_g1_i7:153-587(+)